MQFVYIGAHERCRTSSSACLNCFSYIFFVRWIRACISRLWDSECYTFCLSYNHNNNNNNNSSGKWPVKRKKEGKSFSSSIFSLLYRFSSKIIFTFKSKAVGDACDVRMRFSVYVSSPPLCSSRTQFDCCPMPVDTYLRTMAVSRGNRVRIFRSFFLEVAADDK